MTEPLGPDRKQLFLAHLRRQGNTIEAARAASPGSTSPRGARTTFYDERARDPEFASAWDKAIRRELDPFLLAMTQKVMA